MIGISSIAETCSFPEMRDDHRMRERRDRPALSLRHVQVQHGEATHIELIDEPAMLKARQRAFDVRQRRLKYRLWRQRCRIDPRSPRRGS